jgi:hypothetical protein
MTHKRKTLYRRLAAIGLLPLAALALAPDFALNISSALPLLATEQAEQSKPADSAVTPQPQSQLPPTAPIDEELTFDETAFALNDPQPELGANGGTAPVNPAALLVAFEPNFKGGMSHFLGRGSPQESGSSGSIKPVIGTTAPHPSTGGSGKPANNNGNPPTHEDQAGQTPGDKPATDDAVVGTGPSDDNPTLPNDDPLPGNPDNPLPSNPDGKPVATVPEPSSLVLLIVGVIGLLIARRRFA